MPAKKVALVSGANRGLGLEIARQLGRQGITVVLGARREKDATAAAARLRGEGIDAHAVILEVTNPAHVAALAPYFEKTFGRLDILINNAGVLIDRERGNTVEALRETYEVNVFAPYALARTLLPLLRKSPAGRIVNHSSMLGSIAFNTMPEEIDASFLLPAYNSSKAALNALTVILARELEGTNIKVNAAHPGWVKTEMGGSEAPMGIEEGAQTAVRLALLPADGPTGGFFHKEEQLPW